MHLDRVNIALTPPTDEEIQRQYARHRVDIAGLDDPSNFEGDPALARGITRIPQYSVIFLTLVPSRNRALRDVRVRRAIALGIDRVQVAQASPLVQPATSLVPSTLRGFDAGAGFREDVAEARRLMAAAGYPGGKGFPTLSIMTSHDDPFVRGALRSLRRNLAITAGQDIEDPDVLGPKAHEVQPARFAGYFSTGYTGISAWRTWVSSNYPPSQTELLSLAPDDYTRCEVLQAKGTARALATAAAFLDAHASPQARRFAAVAARADATADPVKAAALYKAAAAIRQSTYEFVPLLYSARVYAVRPGIKGVHLWPGYFTISFKDVRVT